MNKENLMWTGWNEEGRRERDRKRENTQYLHNKTEDVCQFLGRQKEQEKYREDG